MEDIWNSEWLFLIICSDVGKFPTSDKVPSTVTKNPKERLLTQL